MPDFTNHPAYDLEELTRYRLTYDRGKEFMAAYLYKHYEEDNSAWADRKKLSYNPAFAAEAVDEYVRAIVQRSSDIHRVGGHQDYRAVMRGEFGGIDRQGSSMNAFMSKNVTPELLSMGTCGIYVDNDRIKGATVAQTKGKYPFAYGYRAENILNWRYDPNNPNELMAVLLREYIEDIDSELQLCKGIKTRHRHIMRKGNKIIVTVYDENNKQIDQSTQETAFPFVLARLPHSLLKVTSFIQIALLNLSSSDLYYAWGSNFPLYTEQYDPLAMDRLKETRDEDQDKLPIAPDPDDPNNGAGQANWSDCDPNLADALKSAAVMRALPPGPATGEQKKIKHGNAHGRLYPQGTERPGYVHPSSEPLRASMEKENQLKMEIRQLTALAVTRLEPKHQASAESKQLDNLGLEAGMAYIAQELEGIENKISAIWHSYYTTRPKCTRIKYPEKYNLKTDEERREEAKQMKELQIVIPSPTYQREISKTIASTLYRDRIDQDILDKIFKEIDDAPGVTSDPDILKIDHEGGAVSDKTYSILRGFDEEEYIQARTDHSDRLARIAKAQAESNPAARGVPDAGEPGKGKVEKKNKPKRGSEDIKPKEEQE